MAAMDLAASSQDLNLQLDTKAREIERLQNEVKILKEQLAAKEQAELNHHPNLDIMSSHNNRRLLGAQGSFFSEQFLAATREAYDEHMGVENMATVLYAITRFIKPRKVLEIGAGYTSLFLLQALADNHEELKAYKNFINQEQVSSGNLNTSCSTIEPPITEKSWLVEDFINEHGGRSTNHSNPDLPITTAQDQQRQQQNPDDEVQTEEDDSNDNNNRGKYGGEDDLSSQGVDTVPKLVCVDNMTHGHTTAHKVVEIADELGLEPYLSIKVGDAWRMVDAIAEDAPLDLLWLDFGVGSKWEDFLRLWCPLVRDGGYVLLHSSLTNRLTRLWLEQLRSARGDPDTAGGHPLGDFSEVSFLEPHKRMQNSFTVLQKRGPDFAEPLYSQYP